MTDIQPIPTRYAGCHFRSRLEARWAVFFDSLGIRWEYEPQGFEIEGRRYLPDFLLDGSTWIEVKGSERALDKPFLLAASKHLHELTVLGPVPRPLPGGDWGWVSVSAQDESDADEMGRYGQGVGGVRQGFGAYRKNRRLWYMDDQVPHPTYSSPVRPGSPFPWTEPLWSEFETNIAFAYEAARSARFEHGRSG